MNTLKNVVEIFYHKCLTVNSETNAMEVLGKLLADDFKSKNAAGEKNKLALIGTDCPILENNAGYEMGNSGNDRAR